jgi:hypothetical protein
MHLVEDKLKNPCLDYLRHIVFAPPGATFTAGGNTFTDFASASAAFLNGNLSEEGAPCKKRKRKEGKEKRASTSAAFPSGCLSEEIALPACRKSR